VLVIAHILGMPVEESLVSLGSGMAAGMLLGLASIMSRVRRRGLRK